MDNPGIFKMKTENAKAIAIILVVVVAVVLIIIYANKFFGGIGNLFTSITDKLGITDSPQKQAQDAAIASAQAAANQMGSPWNVSYYKNAPAGASLLTAESGDALAKQIYDSVSTFFANDGAACVAAIKECTTKSQLSFLVDRFQQSYNDDLYTFIVKNYTGHKYFIFTEDEDVVTAINTYVASLPNYNA